MDAVKVRPVSGNDRGFMESVMEKYLYEMSPFSDIRMDVVGNYSYPRLNAYFTRNPTSRRKLYIIEVGEEPAGFAMLNDISPFDGVADELRPSDHASPDWCMAEFTVFPKFRNHGVGQEAAELIFADNPGRWELMFDERNVPARCFWTLIGANHDGMIHPAGEHSRVLTFMI